MSSINLDPDQRFDHRQTAAEWHGGQRTPLYAYASTGTVVRGLDSEIRDCLDIVEHGAISRDADPVTEHERLVALLHHIEADVVVQEASDIGRQHGESAAAWWQQDALGGRATGDAAATARRVLKGIDDGDPAILDALPGPDDGYTTAELEDDCDWDEPDLDDQPAHSRWRAARSDIWDAYRSTFHDTVSVAVADVCRNELAEIRTAYDHRLDAAGRRQSVQQPVAGHTGLGL
jgi:hypothetical protein